MLLGFCFDFDFLIFRFCFKPFDFHFVILLLGFCFDFDFLIFRFCFKLFDLHLAILIYIMKTKTKTKTLLDPITFENENQKHKNQNQNRLRRPSYFAGGSIWRIKVSIRRSAALLTMLAQVNYLILAPLIALNHKLYLFSTHLLIFLLKLWKSR